MNDSILERDKENILRLYSEQGFWNTEVEIKKVFKKRGVHLIFIIKEGERVKFKWSGLVNGTRATLPSRFQEVVHNERELEFNIKRVLQYYADEGRPFAKVSPKNFAPQRDTIIYDLEILAGDSVWIDSISFQGNITRAATLKRFLKFPQGFLFSERKVSSKIRRLLADRENPTEFKGLEILSKKGGYEMRIHLKERRERQFGLLFTYLPKEREFAGFLTVALTNLFYTRRHLVLRVERRGRDREYFLSYTEPLLFFTDKAFVNFQHKSYDTLRAKTTLNGGFAIRMSQEFLTLSFLLGHEMVREQRKEDIRFSYLGQELTWESREGILPRKGEYLSLFSYAGDRRAQGTLRALKSGLVLKGEVLFDLKRVIPSLAFFGEGIFVDTLLEQEKTYLGGRERLRGFREEEFPSSLVFLNRLELKLPSGDNFFFPFFDWGGRSLAGGLDLHASYGFGFELLTTNSYLEFIYAIPYSQNILSGKIHLLTKLGF